MEGLQNKDKSIKIIWDVIISTFGVNLFSIVDFWDADNYAFGIKKDNKLIYISTWDFRECQGSKIKCYSEFELIDEETNDTKQIIKQLTGIFLNDLLVEIKEFMIEM